MGWLNRLFGSDSLHKAAEEGNYKQVKELIERGVDVNQKAPTIDRETPLLRAAGEGHLNVVQLLINNGADVNAQISKGGTPLHYATSHPEVARILLKHGADLNVRGYRGATPLHYAAAKGIIESARLLIENGADVNAKDDLGRTPFRLAANGGHVEIGQLLFVAGAEEPMQAAKERFDHETDSRLGIKGKASLSARNHPICPICNFEFPIDAKAMQEQSDGIPIFRCPKCENMIRL